MQFRFGSIPVRVHASFFVMAVLLGAVGGQEPVHIVISVAVVCASIFVHELGHAFMGRAFGLEPAVELYAMGGLTSFAPGRALPYGRRILISLAGPAVGLVVAGLLLAGGALGVVPRLPNGAHHLTLGEAAVWIAFYVNGIWSLFNLLPMLPLDGGNVTKSTLDALTKGRGERPARLISLAVAVGVAVLALARKDIWIVMLCASFAVQNGRMLGKAGRADRDDPMREVLARAVADLNTGNARGAITAAELVAGTAHAPELRADATRILAYALVADGRWSQLMPLLEGGHGPALADDDLGRFEEAARASGSREVAGALARMRAERTHVADVRFNAG